MPDGSADLIRRYASSRPGRELVAVEDAGIPVTLVRAEVIAQERKPLPIVDEMVLRLVSHGIDRPGVIAECLGIGEDIVAVAVAGQMSSSNLGYVGIENDRRLNLTPPGQGMVVELASLVPIEETMTVCFDRLSWMAEDYDQAYLLSKREVRERGAYLLPPAKTDSIGVGDIGVGQISRLLPTSLNRRTRSITVLGVRSVQSRTTKYLPVKMLVFADLATRALETAVAIDGLASAAHESALSRLEIAKRLDITFSDENIVEPAVERVRSELTHAGDASRSLSQSDGVDSALHPDEAETDSPPVSSSVASLSPDSAHSNAAPTSYRNVAVSEHRGLLESALREARRRILIISPWIQRKAITTVFLQSLEQALRRRVTVHIAYGFGEDAKSDSESVRRLENLRARYRGTFSFVRVKNTHAKVLIWDDIQVTTSFNWLSFLGDANRTYRMEQGVLVEDSVFVSNSYREFVEAISAQAREDSGPSDGVSAK